MREPIVFWFCHGAMHDSDWTMEQTCKLQTRECNTYLGGSCPGHKWWGWRTTVNFWASQMVSVEGGRRNNTDSEDSYQHAKLVAAHRAGTAWKKKVRWRGRERCDNNNSVYTLEQDSRTRRGTSYPTIHHNLIISGSSLFIPICNYSVFTYGLYKKTRTMVRWKVKAQS